MSDRRRLLLTLLNQGVWLPYSFEYLYHDLIPTTIDSKQVKNKLKLATIYGNSVVENQMVEITQSKITGSGVSNTINGTQVSFTATTIGGTRGQFSQLNFIQNHKYFVCAYLTQSENGKAHFSLFTSSFTEVGGATFTLQANTKTYCSSIITAKKSAIGGNLSLYQRWEEPSANVQIGDNIIADKIMLIDLTQRHPFDTPTTLTDNRVQAILNRGYIPYNSGELKSVDIGEFSSEPYNLFDEETELGRLDLTTGENYADNTQIRAKNYIPVVGGETYTMEIIGGNSQNSWAMFFDKDKNVIEGVITGTSVASNARAWNNGVSITMPNNCCYVRFYLVQSYGTTYLNNICLHRTGTRTGYAPHTDPQTISFKYQGSGVNTSKDSMEITDTSYVFTKNNGVVDLGMFTWSYNDIYSFFQTNGIATTVKPITNNNINFNGITGKYITSNFTNILQSSSDKCMSLTSGNNLLQIKDTAYTDAATFKTAMSGVMLYYELATPQVITIPRKKLGVVYINELTNLAYLSSYGVFVGTISDKKASNNNIFCSQLLTTTEAIGSMSNLTIRQYYYGTAKDVLIKDTSCTTTQQLLDKYSGVPIFYETDTEVSDIIDTIGVEAGGTFTSDSEVLPNVDTKIKGK